MSDQPLIKYVVVYADISWVYDYPDKEYTGGDTLLVLKDRPEWMKGRLNLLGGKIDPGEEPIEAAVRELKEESGLDGKYPEYMGHIVGTKSIIHCVKLMVDPLKPIQPREGETEKVGWYHWNEVESDPRLMPNLRITVPLMKTHYAPVQGWILQDKNQLVPGERFHDVFLTFPQLLGHNATMGRCLKISIGRPDEKLSFVEVEEIHGKKRDE